MVQRSTGFILAGNHRWQAAKAKGLRTLPALIYDIDDDTALRILSGDNAYARMATWDPVKLVALMERFGEDLHATGWTPADVAIACAQAGDAAGLGRDYNPATIGPVLVIHCGQDLVDAFRSIEAGTDAGRLAYLLSLDGAAVSG